MAYKDIEKRRAYHRAYSVKWRAANRDKLREKWHSNKGRWYKPERRAVLRQKRRLELKTEVLTHYGNDELACVRCSFTDIRALTLDHVNGGGCQERKEMPASGINLYEVLKRKGYPIGYQTLCGNCQFIKQAENKEYGNYTLAIASG